MINSISGRITEKGPGLLFISTGGIEWEITVPDSLLPAMPPSGSDTKIYIYLQHNDSQMKLFGFPDKKQRSLFLSLLKVGGIGPRQAVKILSGISVEGFIQALDKEDINALIRLPGLGKKTAQKIILSLRGKLASDGEESTAESNELVDALCNMGFDKKKAVKAVKASFDKLEHGDFSGDELEKAVFREAIVLLSSK